MNPEYLSVRETASYFGVSRRHIYNLISAREIAHITVGNVIRIAKKDVENFEKRNRQGIKRKQRANPF